MRLVKSILLLSVSVFLLAAAWALLTGNLLPVRGAQAQSADPIVAVVSIPGAEYFEAITASGEVWRYQSLSGSLRNQTYKGNVFGDEGR